MNNHPIKLALAVWGIYMYVTTFQYKGIDMGTITKSGFCKDCDKRGKVTRDTPAHLLHLILSVFTAGLWLPVWILLALFSGAWRCGVCGGKRVSRID